MSRPSSVLVATAANPAEAELLQQRLAAAGIDSTVRATFGDVPQFLQPGPEGIYVSAEAAEKARVALAGE